MIGGERKQVCRIVATLCCLIPLLTAQSNRETADVLRQGERLEQSGQFQAAQELYEKATRAFPEDAGVAFALGMVYFRGRDWNRAILAYQNSLRLGPVRLKPLFYLAQAYYMKGELDQALEAIRQATVIAPADPQVCQKYGEYLDRRIDTRPDGLAWLEKARRLNPHLPGIDYGIGMAQFKLGDFPGSVSSFEAALDKDSADGSAAFFLAESWAKLNDWKKAREYYQVALENRYSNGPAFYGLGRALVELGDYSGALGFLQKALAAQPAITEVHFQLARAYRELRRTADARREVNLYSAMAGRIDTAGELKGPEEEAAWRRVQPLLEAGKEEEAIAALSKSSASAAADRTDPHYLAGVVYAGMGQKEDACRLLSIAQRRVPDSPRIAAYLGLLQLASGKSDVAESSFRSALALDSGHALALVGMGEIRYQQGRWADAVEYLEKSRTADPRVLYLLCDAYFKLDRAEEGRLTAEVIRAFASDNKTLLSSLEELLKAHQVRPAQPSLTDSGKGQY